MPSKPAYLMHKLPKPPEMTRRVVSLPPKGRFVTPKGRFVTPGNIGSNPLFAADGHHLTSSSPCIDEGDAWRPYGGQVDIDNEDRVMGDNVDMGVDEYDPS